MGALSIVFKSIHVHWLGWSQQYWLRCGRSHGSARFNLEVCSLGRIPKLPVNDDPFFLAALVVIQWRSFSCIVYPRLPSHLLVSFFLVVGTIDTIRKWKASSIGLVEVHRAVPSRREEFLGIESTHPRLLNLSSVEGLEMFSDSLVLSICHRRYAPRVWEMAVCQALPRQRRCREVEASIRSSDLARCRHAADRVWVSRNPWSISVIHIPVFFLFKLKPYTLV